MSWTLVVGCGASASKGYEAVFRENEINERVLPSLTAEDLKELGAYETHTLWVFVGVIACPAAYRRRAHAVTYRATNATQINKKGR